MPLSRLPGRVGEITVEGNPTRVQASKTIAHDIAFELTPRQLEQREIKMLNFNPPPPKQGYKRCTNCMGEQRYSTDPSKSAFSPHIRKERSIKEAVATDKELKASDFHSWCKTCRAEQARRWRQTAPKA